MAAGAELSLPEGTARHVQVLRLQPGHQITLFNGQGGEWDATITRMGRSDVDVSLGAHRPDEREAGRAVQLALGMPANERMDWLVEKATELGAASLQPLHTSRSVLRLAGERADKKQKHWQSVAVAACEQCGGNRVPPVAPVQDIAAWLKALPPVDPQAPGLRCLLSLADGSMPMEPVSMEASSDKMSPNMLPVTTTSNFLGAFTSCMAALSTYMCSNSTSGYSWCTSVTTSFQNWKVSSTLALSTLVTFLFRLRAA
jgi:16S rRNA (uracil1498-N3)-methyltransferase